MKLDAVRGLTVLLAVTVLLYCDPFVSFVHARDDVSPQQRTPSSSCPQSVKRWDRPFGAVLRGAEAVGYHNDGQLSTRHLTDAAAQITDSYTYDAFGVTLASSGSTLNNYLYTGEQLDPNVGFYYLRARYLNQEMGKFISTDPFTGIEADPASLHRYLYAALNPVSNLDPSGEFTLLELSGATLGLAILITAVLIATAVFIYFAYQTTGARARLMTPAELAQFRAAEAFLPVHVRGTLGQATIKAVDAPLNEDEIARNVAGRTIVWYAPVL